MIPRATSPRRATPMLLAPPVVLALVALTSCAATTAPKGARSVHDAESDSATSPSELPRPATPEDASSPSAGAAGHGPVYQRGVATYYADKFVGRATATGERYDPNALTAAHLTLPFGSVVDVARADGRHVTVRINDRGPYAKGHVIDLSRRAAREIGLLEDGIARVMLRVVSVPAKAPNKKRRHR